jgi:hypothetical protein
MTVKKGLAMTALWGILNTKQTQKSKIKSQNDKLKFKKSSAF